MKIYIQSRSGDFNSTQDIEGIGTLQGAFKYLRNTGSYVSEYRDKEVRVPFEEIEFIRKATEND
jgi:hypothetical protein